MVSPEAKKELTPTGKLRVGIKFSNELLTDPSTKKDPQPRGIALDLARELARRLGVPIEFHRYDSAGATADSVRTGAWDVAFLGAEPQRAAEMTFTAPYLEIEATYLVPPGSPLKAVADVDRAGLGVFGGSEHCARSLHDPRPTRSGPRNRDLDPVVVDHERDARTRAVIHR